MPEMFYLLVESFINEGYPEEEANRLATNEINSQMRDDVEYDN